MTEWKPNLLDSLSQDIGREWPTIIKARKEAEAIRSKIREGLIEADERIISSDSDVVVFGSVARNECTKGSDVDWTLLIDGQAFPEHQLIAQQIARRIEEKHLIQPAVEGIFGKMAFSHDIIHHIGGQRDSNHNTTQRILLLLESCPIRFNPLPESEYLDNQTTAYDRVVRGILYRYLIDDSSFISTEGIKSKVPRFLLNDLVRFWRTMCVDFACKEWEQGGKKWALRNIKLRMSRKLIFVSGFLTMFSCYLNPALEIDKSQSSEPERVNSVLQHLTKYVNLTPPRDCHRDFGQGQLQRERGPTT